MQKLSGWELMHSSFSSFLYLQREEKVSGTAKWKDLSPIFISHLHLSIHSLSEAGSDTSLRTQSTMNSDHKAFHKEEFRQAWKTSH